MLVGELKSKVDRLWDEFWSGGVSNPLTVIEQITYLMFLKSLDDAQTKREDESALLGTEVKNIFGENEQQYRWKTFKLIGDPNEQFRLMQQEIFPFLQDLFRAEDQDNESVFSKYMKGATFMIPNARLLTRVLEMLEDIDRSDADTKGDIYEYLLNKLASAGKNGQFRTPRHIIKMMVEMMQPSPTDRVCDPSAGTCGFLVATNEYIRTHHRSALYNKDTNKHFHHEMFNGIEFDATMLRIGAMNLILHGIDAPNLHGIDALSADNHITGAYDLVLANPPFKGSLDADSVATSLKEAVKTKKTELLFLALMLRLLKTGGRCAVIVPDGVLFGSSKAHKDIRKLLVETHRLESVISMPSGVFKPYAGVSTAILIFTKTGTGGTDKVWFYDMKSDGYELNDKRTELGTTAEDGTRTQSHTDNNIPDILARWHNLDGETNRKRTEQSFFVPKSEIKKNAYDLSINRYKEIIYEAIEYDAPDVILDNIKKLDSERADLIRKLEKLMEV